jgi:predicted dehydrogenase
VKTLLTEKFSWENEMIRKKNVAIVGCGEVADGHLKGWNKVPSAQVVAVCDLNENLAKTTAKKWRIPNYYKSVQELIEFANLDIVDICTPPHTHSSLAVQIMNAGSNVIVEKPMTMTVKDAEEIVQCQKMTGVTAGVLHNWLFEPPIVEADSLVKRGLLGELFNVEVEAISTKEDSMVANKHHWCHSFPGGRFSEMLAHPIYLVRNFLGEFKIGDVHVSKVGDYPWMKSDELCATFEAENKFGRVYVSFNAPRDAIFVDLYGQKGILKIDIINATINYLPARKTSRFGKGADSLRQAGQLVGSTFKNVLKIASGRWLDGHELYIERFVQNLIESKEPPISVKEGLEVVKTLEDMCRIIEKLEKYQKST